MECKHLLPCGTCDKTGGSCQELMKQRFTDALDVTTWYHVDANGKLAEGASAKDTALYKAEDIEEILNRFDFGGCL